MYSLKIFSMTGDMRKVMVTMVAARSRNTSVVPVTTRLVARCGGFCNKHCQPSPDCERGSSEGVKEISQNTNLEKAPC